uniref:Cell morphogenesis protein N-terminal domain-containing protein n=1 Tax=Quercus lobata TaxID=97700 RepID=A0A7N2KYP6_QUELO
MKAGSAAKLIVDALLQRFLPLARRRIETAQAQDGQYLRPSDPAYEQVLDSLAMIARHTPVPLLEALLRWRESESPKGANDASTFQRKLAVECIFCSACIRFVECCPQEGLTEKLWSGLENFVFDWLINADRDIKGSKLESTGEPIGSTHSSPIRMDVPCGHGRRCTLDEVEKIDTMVLLVAQDKAVSFAMLVAHS